MRSAYSDAYRVKGGAVAHLTLDLPQDLISDLEKRAEKSGQSIPDFIREDLELCYLHRLPERRKGDISDRPEVRRTIQLRDKTRKRLGGSGYSGSEASTSHLRDRSL